MSTLFWQILRWSQSLAAQIADKGSFEAWLSETADRAIERYTRTSRIFQDFEFLFRLAEEWTEFATSVLRIRTAPNGYDRELIYERRKDIAIERRESGKSVCVSCPISDTEIAALVPWPKLVTDLWQAIWYDADDLAYVIRYRASAALRKRAERNSRAFSEFVEDVVNELTLMKGWAIIKNSPEWKRDYEKRIASGDPLPESWSPRVFTNVAEDANKAVNYVLNRPANERTPLVLSPYHDVETTIANLQDVSHAAAEESLLDAAIEKLPPWHKRIIDSFLDEQSIQEIAASCNTTDVRARAMLKEAIAALRRLIPRSSI